MHSPTSFVIFWLPSGYHFDTPTIDQNYPNASDQNYDVYWRQDAGPSATTDPCQPSCVKTRPGPRP